jgi:uncharacterized glyoxalase superfamily protein PhnB
MRPNRSIPSATVIPVLIYPDVREEGRAVIIGDVRHERKPPRPGEVTHSVKVRVEDVNGHCERARAHGAQILTEPTDFEYGEREYEAADPWGHHWGFSETLEDVHPESWGGTLLPSG